MTEDANHGLRKQFQALRATEAGSAPAFEVSMRPARVRRRPWLRLGVATAAAAAVVWFFATRDSSSPYPIDTATASWSAPTDFLLHTPGSDLLTGLPRVGPENSSPMREPAGRGSAPDTVPRARS